MPLPHRLVETGRRPSAKRPAGPMAGRVSKQNPAGPVNGRANRQMLWRYRGRRPDSVCHHGRGRPTPYPRPKRGLRMVAAALPKEPRLATDCTVLGGVAADPSIETPDDCRRPP